MPRIAAPLSDARLRNLKPRDRPYEVTDDGRPGLKVEVQPSGAKFWRYQYMLNGRREKARNADKEATVSGFFEHRRIPAHLSKLRSYPAVNTAPGFVFE